MTIDQYDVVNHPVVRTKEVEGNRKILNTLLFSDEKYLLSKNK